MWNRLRKVSMVLGILAILCGVGFSVARVQNPSVEGTWEKFEIGQRSRFSDELFYYRDRINLELRPDGVMVLQVAREVEGDGHIYFGKWKQEGQKLIITFQSYKSWSDFCGVDEVHEEYDFTFNYQFIKSNRLILQPETGMPSAFLRVK